MTANKMDINVHSIATKGAQLPRKQYYQVVYGQQHLASFILMFVEFT